MREIIKIYIEHSINLATKDITPPLWHIPNDMTDDELKKLQEMFDKEICIQENQSESKESQKTGTQSKQNEKRVSTGTTDSKTD
jgi:hypothetical protein